MIIDLENRIDNFGKFVAPIKTTFVDQKRQIDRSTLYSLDGSFYLFHADVANLEFLRKFAVGLKYCFLFVNLFTSKVYKYPMKSRSFVAKTMCEF